MATLTDRIAQLERGIEYDQAYAEMERVILWARATGHMDAIRERQAWAEMARISGTRESYVAGKWQPPDLAPPVADVCPVDIMSFVTAWEANHG